MKRLLAVIALACSLLFGPGASATTYVFRMTGRISYIANTQYGGGGGSQPLDVTTALKLSDAVSVRGVFDTNDYPQFSPGDTDPTFGYYFAASARLATSSAASAMPRTPGRSRSARSRPSTTAAWIASPATTAGRSAT